MRDSSTANRPSGPSVRDWTLVALNLVFVIAGAAMLWRKPAVGVVTLALFGSFLGLALSVVLRKLRARRAPPQVVDVMGGVPIRMSRRRMSLLALWMLALGVTLVVIGEAYPAPFRWLSGFVALVGAILLALLATGRWAHGYLQFDPEGLTIGRRLWRALIPWDAIAVVDTSDYFDNALVRIGVADLEAVEISPRSAQPLFFKQVVAMRLDTGAEFAIMPAHYGLDAATLAAAFERYREDPQARAALARRALPAA